MSSIIVGVDASDSSEDAADFARDLAGLTGAKLLLASAYRHAPVPSRVPGGQTDVYVEADATSVLERMRDRLGAPDSEAVPDPSPARALHQIAEELDAELIVLGSSHRGRMGRVFPGSTAMRLAHGSPCAIAVVPRGYHGADHRGFERIGCAFDTHEEAAGALQAAAAAAAALHAHLSVIHVFDPATYAPPPGEYGYGVDPNLADLERSAREDVEEAVEQLPQGIAADPVFLEGAPASVLADRSKELELLFAGSRGYGPARAVLLGSVTYALVHEVSCPLILLPRGAKPTLPRVFASPPPVA